MSSTLLAIPKPESYVTEWSAVQNDGPESFGAMRKLVRHTPWVVQMVLDDDGVTYLFTQTTPTGLVQWPVKIGEWLVKSPHDKFWFMSESEFRSQFDLRR